jgi:hypothetical protein
MSFEMLKRRLLGHLRARIQNGELSERSLARLSGISQPHIHNVLKGGKTLSPKLEDKILATLKISILDLFSMEELSMQLNNGGSLNRYRALNVLDGLLGPGFPMPTQASHGEMHPVECSLLGDVSHPQLSRLGADPEMAPFVNLNQLVLLDYSETARLTPKPDMYYATSIGGSGVIRILIKEGPRLFAATEHTRDTRERWQELPVAADPLSIVKARVVWLHR